MESKQRNGPIIQIQKEMLTEFVKKHENLQTGKFSKDFSFKKAQNLWEEISFQLNSIPEGAKKDWRHWRKTWQDLKKNVKAKAVKEKTYSYGTGGGPAAVKDKMDEVENSILEMFSPKVTFGDSTVALSSVQFEFEEDIQQQSGRCSTPNNVETPTVINCLNNSNTVDTPAAYRKDYEYHMKPIDKVLKKVTKTRRLENSLKISQELVRVEEEKKNIMDNYYKEKISFLQHRKTYHKEKLEALKTANLLNQEILKGITELKNNFM